MKTMVPLRIEQEFLFPKPENQPILFEEVFVLDDPKKGGYKKVLAKELVGNEKLQKAKQGILKKFIGVHLIVLVHGLQATRYDMNVIKSLLSYKFPYCTYLSSITNEKRTEGDIGDMG